MSLTTREMQIKAIVKDHHALVRMAKLAILRFGVDMEQLDLSC